MAYAFRGVAPALETLLAQLNAIAPKRKKLSDGALGDAAHAARASFHNPNSSGIVQARDFTHDPAGGLDCNWLAKVLTTGRDPRIHEIIWNRRYWTPKGGWVTYYGSNPHDKHLHLTVRSDPALYNSTAKWDLSPDGIGIPALDGGFLMALTDAQQSALAHDAANARFAAINTQEAVGRIELRTYAMESLLARIVAGGANDLTEEQVRTAAREGVEAGVGNIAGVVRQVVLESLGEDNAEQADAIVDRLVARLAS